MKRTDIILQDAAITRQINLLRFSAGEKKKVLELLSKLQVELSQKLMTNLTDFSKARVNKLLRESTEVINAAYKELASTSAKIASGEDVWTSISDVVEKVGELPRRQYLRFDPKVYKTGDILPPSRKWINEEPTEFIYKGTSVFNPRTKLTKTEMLTQYEGNVYIVKGKVVRKGVDPGEIFIKDPEIVKVIDISDEKITGIDLLGLARSETTATAQSFAAIGLDASLPTEAALKALVNGSLIEGAPSAAWWSKQSDDLSFKFAAQVRQGIAGNETVQQIVRRVIGSPRLGTPGIMETSRRGATALVHTSIQQVANDARLATFKANADVVKGVMQLSTLDSHTTKICIAYSGASWDLDGNPINGTTLPFNGGTPRHWNCRSVLTAITKTYKELGIDIPEAPPGTRASDLGQIPADTSFESFLGRHDKAYVDNLLGPGRADLWRDGKITLQQLVGGDGRELTLKQLSALSSKPQKVLTSFENVVKYSGKKAGLKDAISGIKTVVKATDNYNAKYALTAVSDLKGKAYSGAAIIDKAKNQAAAVSWVKDPARDALKVVTLGSNMPGGGTAMMKQAVQASIDAGHNGRLTLVSVRDLKTGEFYWDKVGMVDLKGGLPLELILTAENAKKFMEKY